MTDENTNSHPRPPMLAALLPLAGLVPIIAALVVVAGRPGHLEFNSSTIAGIVFGVLVGGAIVVAAWALRRRADRRRSELP